MFVGVRVFELTHHPVRWQNVSYVVLKDWARAFKAKEKLNVSTLGSCLLCLVETACAISYLCLVCFWCGWVPVCCLNSLVVTPSRRGCFLVLDCELKSERARLV
jgi:hypothetical protein